MDIFELIENAVSGVEPTRVDVANLEPAAVSSEVVGGLTQVVSELVRNATAFSGPGQIVTINGLFEPAGYQISISDQGVGISESLLTALNRVLEHPSPGADTPGTTMGITTTARVAARHGIRVRLLPGDPGTTARVTVPVRLVTRASRPRPVFALDETVPTASPTEIFASEPTMVDLTRYERDLVPGKVDGGPAPLDPPGMTDEQSHLAEEFLERVFGPLRGKTMVGRDRPAPRLSSNGGNSQGRETVTESRPPVDREPRAGVTALRVRVPGTNFSPVEDDPSVASSEGAIDIRSALSKYELGRRNAATSGD